MTAYDMVVAASLVVGANEVVGGVAEPGWPIVVSALFQPETTVAVVPKELTVRILDARGRAVPIAFEPLPAKQGEGGWVRWSWHAGEAATRALLPGLFSVTVEATPADATVWISAGVLRVLAPGKGRRSARGRLVIERALLQERPDEAMAEVDRLIASDPEDQATWVARGDLLMAKDLPDSAGRSYDQALRLHKSSDGEGLDLWRRKRAAFLRSLEKRGALKGRGDDK